MTLGNEIRKVAEQVKEANGFKHDVHVSYNDHSFFVVVRETYNAGCPVDRVTSAAASFESMTRLFVKNTMSEFGHRFQRTLGFTDTETRIECGEGNWALAKNIIFKTFETVSGKPVGFSDEEKEAILAQVKRGLGSYTVSKLSSTKTADYALNPKELKEIGYGLSDIADNFLSFSSSFSDPTRRTNPEAILKMQETLGNYLTTMTMTYNSVKAENNDLSVVIGTLRDVSKALNDSIQDKNAAKLRLVCHQLSRASDKLLSFELIK